MLALAWGAAAFGAVYPWAYTPLLIAAAGLGLSGIFFGRGRLPEGIVLTALLAIAASTALQLIPLSVETLGAVSPRALDIHRQYDVAAAVGARATFPVSIQPQRTIVSLMLFASFALLLLGSTRMLSRDSTRQLAASLAAVGVVLSVIGIVQRASFNGRIYGIWPLVQGGSPFGPFINRNHFAGWMLMVLPLTIGLFGSIVSRGFVGVRSDARSRLMWFTTPAANQAILTAFAVLVMTLALVLTLSRSGIAALGVAMVAVSVLIGRRHADVHRLGRVLIPIYALAAMLIAFAWVGVDRLASRFAIAGPLDMESRRAIWFDTWRMINDFWLTGTGVNTFGTAALFYQEQLKGTHMQEAHNDYLQIVAEGGVLLAAPVALAIVALALNAHRRLRQDVGSIWWIRVGAISGLLAIAVQSLVEFSLQIPANAALFAVVCGVALHDGGRVVKKRVPNRAPREEGHHPPDQSEKIVRFGTVERRLDFAADRAPAADRGDLDLSDLDDAAAPGEVGESTEFVERRARRQPSAGSRQAAGLIALVLIVLFALLLLVWA